MEGLDAPRRAGAGCARVIRRRQKIVPPRVSRAESPGLRHNRPAQSLPPPACVPAVRPSRAVVSTATLRRTAPDGPAQVRIAARRCSRPSAALHQGVEGSRGLLRRPSGGWRWRHEGPHRVATPHAPVSSRSRYGGDGARLSRTSGRQRSHAGQSCPARAQDAQLDLDSDLPVHRHRTAGAPRSSLQLPFGRPQGRPSRRTVPRSRPGATGTVRQTVPVAEPREASRGSDAGWRTAMHAPFRSPSAPRLALAPVASFVLLVACAGSPGPSAGAGGSASPTPTAAPTPVAPAPQPILDIAQRSSGAARTSCEPWPHYCWKGWREECGARRSRGGDLAGTGGRRVPEPDRLRVEFVLRRDSE